METRNHPNNLKFRKDGFLDFVVGKGIRRSRLANQIERNSICRLIETLIGREVA